MGASKETAASVDRLGSSSRAHTLRPHASQLPPPFKLSLMPGSPNPSMGLGVPGQSLVYLAHTDCEEDDCSHSLSRTCPDRGLVLLQTSPDANLT